MGVKTHSFDVADKLDTSERIAIYLEAAFEEGDPHLISAAIGDAARAYGMTKMAKDTGLTREALYRSFSAEGNPEFSTVLRVLQAMGVRLAPETGGKSNAA